MGALAKLTQYGLELAAATIVFMMVTASSALGSCPDGAVAVVDDKEGATGCLRMVERGRPQRVGLWEWRNEASQVVYRVSYDESGVEDGPGAQFTPTGQKLREFNYSSGKLDGDETSWWSDGHLREARTYRAGKLHGVRKRWVYAPPADRKDCSRNDDTCWEGTQECWIEGHRRSNEACAALYAGAAGERASSAARAPASE